MSSINSILTGPDAFYNKPDYVETTKRDFETKKFSSPSTYRCELESKVWRVFKEILSILIFPIGLWRLIHRLAGMAIVPSTVIYGNKDVKEAIDDVNFENEWKKKRIIIEVDGYKIDAAIIGKAENFGNGRWVSAAGGNCEFYQEHKLKNDSFHQLLEETNSNAIVFNYPGAIGSSGMPSRNAMVKAQRAILKFLEDKDNGIGAKEIITYGHSIGGGVQAEALSKHQFKDDVKYVSIKSRTFSELSAVPGKFLGFIAKIFGWNINTFEASKKLKHPEIILQTVINMEGCVYNDISKTPDYIKDDKIITPEASLAKRLINESVTENKHIIGIPENHNWPLRNPTWLAEKVNELLSSATPGVGCDSRGTPEDAAAA